MELGSTVTIVGLLATVVGISLSSIFGLGDQKRNKLMCNESIEIHVDDFIIRNKKDTGWIPQCAALNYYPLAHIFDRPISDDFQNSRGRTKIHVRQIQNRKTDENTGTKSPGRYRITARRHGFKKDNDRKLT